MGNQHPLDWPGENLVECGSRRATVEKARAPITRRAGMGGDDPAEPRNDATPPFEPVAREILDQIGEKDRVAGTMKEHDFAQRKTSVKDELVDVSRPFGLGSIAKFGIEAKVAALASQPW